MATPEPTQVAHPSASVDMLELLEPANRANPYPMYKKWRDTEPMLRGEFGIWRFTRYDDILSVLRDDRFSSDPRTATVPASFFPDEPDSPFDQMAGLVLLFTDPPDHTRLRTLVNKAFTRRVLEDLRPHITQLVEDLLDKIAAKGEMDVIEDFAYPLPALVICELMGVPVEDRDLFRGLSGDVAPILDPMSSTQPERLEKAVATLGQFLMYFAGLIQKRQADPQDDLLSALASAEEAGDRLSMEELIALCVLVFIAGHETTQNLIGNGLLALLRNRDQLELLRSDPTLARNAVEELLRYDSPVQLTARSATEDIVVSGTTVPKGEQVTVLLGAGNRDPAAFPDPDKLDITRERNAVVSFGGGVHFCLGAPLARIEGQVAFNALLRRFPNIELATDAPEFRETLTLRGLKSLPVRF